jgi:hypothetical protein
VNRNLLPNTREAAQPSYFTSPPSTQAVQTRPSLKDPHKHGDREGAKLVKIKLHDNRYHPNLQPSQYLPYGEFGYQSLFAGFVPQTPKPPIGKRISQSVKKIGQLHRNLGGYIHGLNETWQDSKDRRHASKYVDEAMRTGYLRFRGQVMPLAHLSQGERFCHVRAVLDAVLGPTEHPHDEKYGYEGLEAVLKDRHEEYVAKLWRKVDSGEPMTIGDMEALSKSYVPKENPFLAKAHFGMPYIKPTRELITGGMTDEERAALFEKIDLEVGSKVKPKPTAEETFLSADPVHSELLVYMKKLGYTIAPTITPTPRKNGTHALWEALDLFDEEDDIIWAPKAIPFVAVEADGGETFEAEKIDVSSSEDGPPSEAKLVRRALSDKIQAMTSEKPEGDDTAAPAPAPKRTTVRVPAAAMDSDTVRKPWEPATNWNTVRPDVEPLKGRPIRRVGYAPETAASSRNPFHFDPTNLQKALKTVFK